jgi:hypothetical protein
MDKYQQDEAYVNQIIAHSTSRGWVSRDRYMPHDETKNRYWVLDDENMTLSDLVELEAGLRDGAGSHYGAERGFGCSGLP